MYIFDVIKIAIMNAGVVGNKDTLGAFTPLDGKHMFQQKAIIVAIVTNYDRLSDNNFFLR